MISPQYDAEAMTTPGLRALMLTLTEACNLNCSYCYQRARHGRPMGLNTLQAALRLAHDLGRGEATIVLSGGEPLLVPELVDRVIVEAGSGDRKRLRIRLNTNGSLLRPPRLERLVAAGVELQVSCDGVAEAQDRRAAGTWVDLDRLFETIRERYPEYWRRDLAIAMTVTPANVVYLARSVAWALSRGVHRIRVGLACSPAANGGAWDGTELEAQMMEVYALSLEHLRRTELIPVTYLRPDAAAPSTGPEACGAADPTSLGVAADGSVHGCGMLADVARWHPSAEVRRAASVLRLGHVADPDLATRWRERAARPPTVVFPRAKRAAPRGLCQDCPEREGCLVCPLAGLDPLRVPDAHCRFERLAQRHRQALMRNAPVTRWLAEAGVPDALRSRLAPLIQEARQRIF